MLSLRKVSKKHKHLHAIVLHADTWASRGRFASVTVARACSKDLGDTGGDNDAKKCGETHIVDDRRVLKLSRLSFAAGRSQHISSFYSHVQAQSIIYFARVINVALQVVGMG